MRKLSNCLRLNIPIEAYLRNYIIRLENLTDSQALPIPSTSAIALFLESLLTQEDTYRCEAVLPDAAFDHYAAKLTVAISDRLYDAGYLYIPDRRIVAFNTFLRAHLIQTLCDRILCQRHLQEQQVIYNFMDEFNLSDLREFDALKKSQTRYREAHNIAHLRDLKWSDYLPTHQPDNAGLPIEVRAPVHLPSHRKRGYTTKPAPVQSIEQLAFTF